MDLAPLFLNPKNATHRQYEALRAYFVDRESGPVVARRFGYTTGSLHQLIHDFRQQPRRQFFIEPPRAGAKFRPPDIGLSSVEGLVRLDGQAKAELGAGERNLQGVEVRAQGG